MNRLCNQPKHLKLTPNNLPVLGECGTSRAWRGMTSWRAYGDLGEWGVCWGVTAVCVSPVAWLIYPLSPTSPVPSEDT